MGVISEEPSSRQFDGDARLGAAEGTGSRVCEGVADEATAKKLLVRRLLR